MRIAILLPVKDTSRAKQRLAGVYSQAERTALALAMMKDVFAAVAECRAAEHVFVVSSDAFALEAARARGWQVLREDAQVSESASVDWASRELAARGFDAALRLPCDIPLVCAAEIAELLEVAQRAAAEVASTEPGRSARLCVISPSRDGTGTNALLRVPPDLFPSHFGPDSFAKHLREAESCGAAVRIVRNERIELDVDDADDLAAVRLHTCL